MITTAEEFLRNKVYITQDGIEDVHDSLSNVKEMMIEFAKLHVKAALEAAAEDISEGPSYAMQECILNAYSLENIK